MKTIRKDKTIRIPLHPTLRKWLEIAHGWQVEDCDDVLPKVAARYRTNSSGVQKDAIWLFEKAGFKTTVEMTDAKGNILKDRRRQSHIGFHSLRHTFVSICASRGVPLATVQAIVGHGSPAMTRHYTHIGDDTARVAIDAMPMFESTPSHLLLP